VEQYGKIYHRDPEAVAFCPYRISPLGAHIDHQYGKINGLAIDKGIHLAYSAKHNGVVEMQSLNQCMHPNPLEMQSLHPNQCAT